MGQERLAGGGGKGAAGADAEQESVNGQDGSDSPPGEPEQSAGKHQLHGVADEDDVAAVVAVGDMAGGEEKQDAGQEEREPGVAKAERAMSDEIDLPGDGDGLRFRSDDDEETGYLIAQKVSGLECGGAARRALVAQMLRHVVL